MVHIKHIELSQFKSFGRTTQVPILPGFTVVSGPNGSGKSNILDALLFCLGLATSKGMRAERLPDLVNHDQLNGHGSAETTVVVTFDLSELPPEENFPPEWTVSRRLRVSKNGSYSSHYYINGTPCNVEHLHEHLRRLRIYPEGYNVVLQGDVTRIITMNSRERRLIIDELAGVAEFDRKIEQAKTTLTDVKEQEERYRLIEGELQLTCDRLTHDRQTALKYQQLKASLHHKQQLEIVLTYQHLQQQHQQLTTQLHTYHSQSQQLQQELQYLKQQLAEANQQLESLNSNIKNLTEEEYLQVNAQLTTQKAQQQQLLLRQQELQKQGEESRKTTQQIEKKILDYREQLIQLQQEQKQLQQSLPPVQQAYEQAWQQLEKTQEQASAIAASSQLFLQEQTYLTHNITQLQNQLQPQHTQQAQLTERQYQLQSQIQQQTQRLTEIQQQIIQHQEQLKQFTPHSHEIEQLQQQLTSVEEEHQLLQQTQTRLIKEQREKQRQLDKLEATKAAQQEIQGTHASNLVIKEIAGVCGLVAQLAQVEPIYQLALEIAAGGRMGFIVVENDSIAATGIELLKTRRAGRATFLPLNKIQASRIDTIYPPPHGFIDLAVNLVECHPRYRQIFAYVFGNTVVFDTMEHARLSLRKYRIVTLAGELLETSGAMTGGSSEYRSGLHFGTTVSGDSQEIDALQKRVSEIDDILAVCGEDIRKKEGLIRGLNLQITELKQQQLKQQLQQSQLQQEIASLIQEQQRVAVHNTQHQQEVIQLQEKLAQLHQDIPILEEKRQQQQQLLQNLEASHSHGQWQEIQGLIQQQQSLCQQQEASLQKIQQQLAQMVNDCGRWEEKLGASQQALVEEQQRGIRIIEQQNQVATQLIAAQDLMNVTEGKFGELGRQLHGIKQERDAKEKEVSRLVQSQQHKSWEEEKLQESMLGKSNQLQSLLGEINGYKQLLPELAPEITSTNLQELQKEIRQDMKKLEAMEPVNMLAIEEFEKTSARLEDLSQKLTTLQGERTELLIRIENFTTLRLKAFREAFEAVNQNFQEIFAILSEGDGYLHLDDQENPFAGGLNLVAHPKGKPVQRLTSMSGGEKSLTALSFIFALQRYRPSPFYAFDEVDMFLDGANVERLAKMIQRQAQQAQFIVVSLRRPMIEASERAIGVTQARGAYTQVIGIKI